MLWGMGCDGCGDDSPIPPSPTPASDARVEPWLMGASAADRDAALPPPCRARDDALTTVLRRETRIASEPHSLGTLLVAEGATHTVGGRPAHPALALKRWSADASGRMIMGHGAAEVVPMPWSPRPSPVVARAEDGWLVLADRQTDRGEELGLWHAGNWERLGDANALRPASLRCRGRWCAMLTPALNATGVPTGRAGATVWLGRAAEPVLSWQRHSIALAEARPFAIAGIALDEGEPVATAALVDDLRVRFVAVGAAEPQVIAEPALPHGALAVTEAGSVVAVGYAGPAGNDRCDPVAGGVLVAVGTQPPVQLRSALRADRGAAHAIEGGVLVTWLAPARCDGPRRVLHAVVVDDKGRPAAPVTVVGEAEGYAVATDGRDVDIWIRSPGGFNGPADMGTIVLLRARCTL
jgi:hypothetical protein